jgi:hypothetical protein
MVLEAGQSKTEELLEDPDKGSLYYPFHNESISFIMALIHSLCPHGLIFSDQAPLPNSVSLKVRFLTHVFWETHSNHISSFGSSFNFERFSFLLYKIWLIRINDHTKLT